MSQRMRWIALGAVLMTLLLGACQGSMGVGRPVTATPARQAARNDSDVARLTVDVVPAGASVSIDDRPVGVSPLEVELQPGKYYISITAPGCIDITELVELEAGRTTDFSPELRDIAPPVIELKADPPQIPWASRTILEVSASDNVGVAELQLLLDGQVLATTRGDELSMDLYPADVDGLTPVYTSCWCGRPMRPATWRGRRWCWALASLLPPMRRPRPRPT